MNAATRRRGRHRDRRAVFLDRDGTIIEHVHHLRDPAEVRLLPGAGEALRILRNEGYAVVVVTNQSVVGRGLLSEDGLAAVHAEMCRQLAELGVELDGLYYCPIAPTGSGLLEFEHPDRKPGPGMLLRAARELELDVSKSWMIGDALTDILAGRNAGCASTILVRTRYGATQPVEHPAIAHLADDLAAAAELILSLDGHR